MSNTSQSIQELRSLIDTQARTIATLQRDIMMLKRDMQGGFRDIVVGNSIVMGEGETAFHADKDAFWWGKRTLAEIVGGAKGVAILMDGTFYQNP